ncbi:hypothetical protein ES695_17755 [Candidatus Atribacteria bacterium 1244-E10-H5-B2]|nr:MAG: hypothetical protein ES695_17755 [Candidatus Atribacteria bacterium 1244-E10-H5-B2]
MSLYDYRKSKKIAAEDQTFTSLIMAATWKADISNLGRLRTAFPDIIEELEKIYFRGDKLKCP